MKEELLILVDAQDNPIGFEEKVKCHLPNGKLHRAFTALLFDNNGNLVLTKRSPSKMLWPNDWDGTVASHPRKSEDYVSSAERRMPEELGVKCKMDYLFKFEYHVPYKNVGSENEICGTLIGIIDRNTKFNLVEDEIIETKWIKADKLKDELVKNPEIFCPWMLIALFLLPSSEKKIIEKYQSILNNWVGHEIREHLKNAIKFHLPEEKWRLIK